MSPVSEIIQLQGTTVVAAASMVCTACFSAALALSFIAYKFLDSAARQPEIAPKLFNQTILICGLVDVLPLFGIVVAFIFTFLSPFATKAVSLLTLLS